MLTEADICHGEGVCRLGCVQVSEPLCGSSVCLRTFGMAPQEFPMGSASSSELCGTLGQKYLKAPTLLHVLQFSFKM